MTPELAELLRCYAAWQECPLHEQADKQEAFERAVKATAEKHGIEQGRIAAWVRRQWEVMCQKEDKRLGSHKGRGI